MLSYAARSLSIVFTALYLLISIGSCSIPQTDPAFSPTVEATDASPTQLSINLLQSMPDISLELQRATERYAEESCLEMVFHIQTIPGREDYRAALRTKLLAGEKVDLFHILDRSDVNRLEESLEDLSALSWAGRATVGTLDTVSIGSGQYGIPYSLEGIGLIVNRAIFENAALPLNDINNFESLSEAFAALQEKIDTGELAEEYPELVAVTDLAAQDSEYLAERISELLLCGAFSSPRQAREALSLHLTDSEGTDHLLKLFAAASPQRGNWKAFAEVPYSRIIEGGIASGRIAAVVDSTEVYHRIYAANPDMQGNLALLPLYFENIEQGVVFTGTPAWWAVNRGSDEAVKHHAAGFLTWLYTTDDGNAVLADGFGVLSPYRDGAPDSGVVLHSQLLQAVGNDLRAPQLARESPSGWADQVFAAELREYFTLPDKTWEEVVLACKTGWSERRS